MNKDELNGKIDRLKGNIKEGVGKATNDDSVKAKGKRDQSKADMKDAGEKVKDAVKR
jgi:uncharacterized protein YjbJ (UPF0337 family)